MSRDSDMRKTAAMVADDKAAPKVHEHPIADVTGLAAALNGKAANDHNHNSAYAPLGHNHDASYAALSHNHDGAYDPVGSASAALTAALAADFSGAYADLTGKPTLGDAAALDIGTTTGSVAAGDHTHPGGNGGAAWGEVTGTLADQTDLQAALDAKSASNHNHDAAYAAVGHNHDSAYEAKNANIQSHIASTSNPHGVTKAQVGLGNVDNTSDAAKPVSTATQTALDAKQNSLGFTAENSANKGQANGYASLGADGKVPSAQLPASGSDPWTIVSLASDFTTTSSSAVDVTGLSFTPAANTNYMFEAVIGLRTATATVNPRAGLAWATGMSDGVAQIDESQTATTRLMANGNINASLLCAVGGLPNTTQSWPATVWGWVRAGATPSGSVRIQLASETAGTTVRVVARSYLRYRTYP